MNSEMAVTSPSTRFDHLARGRVVVEPHVEGEEVRGQLLAGWWRSTDVGSQVEAPASSNWLRIPAIR